MDLKNIKDVEKLIPLRKMYMKAYENVRSQEALGEYILSNKDLTLHVSFERAELEEILRVKIININTKLQLA